MRKSLQIGYKFFLLSLCTSLYAKEKMTLICHENEALVHFGAHHGHGTSIHPLVATVTDKETDFTKLADLLQKIHEAHLDPVVKELFTEEALCKILAYRTCKGGETFTITSPEGPISYSIDRVFEMGGGIPAYGCLPTDTKSSPLLIFRGSEFAFNKRGKATMRAILDTNGSGFSMYKAARPQIREWLFEQQTTYGKAKVMGFSLGGALAAYAVIFDPEFFHTGVAFNMVGVRRRMIKRWQGIRQEERPRFIAYVNRGDPVSRIGSLLGDVSLFFIPGRHSPGKAHNLLLSSEAKVFFQKR